MAERAIELDSFPADRADAAMMHTPFADEKVEAVNAGQIDVDTRAGNICKHR